MEAASRREILTGMVACAAGVVFEPLFTVAGMGASGRKRLPRTSPEAVGIDPLAIADFVDEVNKTVGGLHTMMLVRYGKVAAEAAWKPYQESHPHQLYSLSKSFNSTAVGLAVAEGRLTIE